MKYGQVVTLEDMNDMFIKIYTLANGIIPDLSLLITTAQIRYYFTSASLNNDKPFPSKFGVQYFENDDEGLLTSELSDRINRILGE